MRYGSILRRVMVVLSASAVAVTSMASSCGVEGLPTELDIDIPASLDHFEIVAPTTMFVGSSGTTSITAHNADGSAYTLSTTTTYESSNPTVATIDGAVLRGVSTKGSASQTVTITATATSEGGLGVSVTKTSTAQVTVQRSLAAIALDPADKAVAVGDNYLLKATPTSVQGAPTNLTPAYTYSSTNIAVASVDVTGKVVAVSPGTTTLRATADGISSNDAKLTISGAPLALRVTPGSTTVAAGATATFALNQVDANDEYDRGRSMVAGPAWGVCQLSPEAERLDRLLRMSRVAESCHPERARTRVRATRTFFPKLVAGLATSLFEQIPRRRGCASVGMTEFGAVALPSG